MVRLSVFFSPKTFVVLRLCSPLQQRKLLLLHNYWVVLSLYVINYLPKSSVFHLCNRALIIVLCCSAVFEDVSKFCCLSYTLMWSLFCKSVINSVGSLVDTISRCRSKGGPFDCSEHFQLIDEKNAFIPVTRNPPDPAKMSDYTLAAFLNKK